MILSDKSILMLNSQGFLIETPLTEEQIQTQLQPNSIDITLAPSWKKIKPNATFTSDEIAQLVINYIDLKKEILYDSGEMKNGYYMVMPGEFILMASNEIVKIPNGIVAIVCGRSSIARVAVQTEQAGFIDSGFRGTITFEIFNQCQYPIKVYQDMRLAQLYFIRAEQADKLYGEKGNKYNDQILATESRIHKDFENNLSHVNHDFYKYDLYETQLRISTSPKFLGQYTYKEIKDIILKADNTISFNNYSTMKQYEWFCEEIEELYTERGKRSTCWRIDKGHSFEVKPITKA